MHNTIWTLNTMLNVKKTNEPIPVKRLDDRIDRP